MKKNYQKQTQRHPYLPALLPGCAKKGDWPNPQKLEYIPGTKRNYDHAKRKHYDQSYEEAIVAEMVDDQSVTQIAHRRGNCCAHALQVEREDRKRRFSLMSIAPKTNCAGAFASLRAQ
jgi:hypothetical protein